MDCYWHENWRRQQPGPGPGWLGWLAWFKMPLGLGRGGRALFSVRWQDFLSRCHDISPSTMIWRLDVIVFRLDAMIFRLDDIYFAQMTLVFAWMPDFSPRRHIIFREGPGLGPWPLQCMHKSVVHAQECCACTGISCMHKNPVHAQYTLLFVHNNKYCSGTFPYQRSDFLFYLHLHSRLRLIQWRIVKFLSCKCIIVNFRFYNARKRWPVQRFTVFAFLLKKVR